MKTKVLIKGPGLSQSGYGEQTRFALRALKSREDLFDIYFLNIPWGNTNLIVDESEEKNWMISLIQKTAPYLQNGQPLDMSIQVTIPNEFEKIAPVNIGYTAGIETTQVAPIWLQKSNENVNKLIVVSNHSKQIFEKTIYQAKNEQTGEEFSYRLQVPVDAVNFGTKEIRATPVNLDLKHDFNYLVVGQWGPRKNLEQTLRWFVEENIDQEVGLVFKVNKIKNCYIDFDWCEKHIRHLLSEYPDRKCTVTLLHGYMTEAEMRGLVTHPKIKAMINISHGEGFGLPLFEAAQEALPVITIDWSGQVDFLYAPQKDKKTKKTKMRSHFVKVDFNMSHIQDNAVWEGVLQKESQWAFAKEGSYKMKLREMRNKYDLYKARAKKLAKYLKREKTESKQHEKFVESLSVYVADLEKDQFAVFEALNK